VQPTEAIIAPKLQSGEKLQFGSSCGTMAPHSLQFYGFLFKLLERGWVFFRIEEPLIQAREFAPLCGLLYDLELKVEFLTPKDHR
jgi:hypothetical protein